MYKVIIYKHIHSCFAALSSNDTYVQKKLELNFIPFVGLNIIDKDFESDDLKSISYNVDTQCFNCYVEEDKTYYDVKKAFSFIASKEQMQKLVEKYTKYGWTEYIK
jgi:hypothetical protein